MLTAYNYNRNPRNLSTLNIPEYPIIDGEQPERYRTVPQPTAVDGSSDRKIDAQEAMKLGFDLEKQITFRHPKGMNPFGGFRSTGRVNKIDRFDFDFGHLSIKDQPENRQKREPFNMPTGINPSYEIDLAPAQRQTPVHRLRRRQDTQTLVTPLYSEVANASTAHLSQLVSNKRMANNRDGVVVNLTKNDPNAGNTNNGDAGKMSSVKRVQQKRVTTHDISAGEYNTGAHGLTEIWRSTADLRDPKQTERMRDPTGIHAGKTAEGTFKGPQTKINPDLLLPRREFFEVIARQETDYRTQSHDAAGKFNPGERIRYVPESDIRRQAGYETGFRWDLSARDRNIEMNKHYNREGQLVDSLLTGDQSSLYQVRAGNSSIADPRALRQYGYYNLEAVSEPEYKLALDPDVPDTMDRMIKTMPEQDIHAGASMDGNARNMLPSTFGVINNRGRGRGL